jgi:hypothetical protein
MVLSRLTSSNGAVVSPKQSLFGFIPAAGSKADIFAAVYGWKPRHASR